MYAKSLRGRWRRSNSPATRCRIAKPQSLRVAPGGTRQGLMVERSTLRSDFAAVLGPGVAPHNSLRSLRSLRSDNCGESAHEARCARRPQSSSPRRPTNRRCRVPPAAKAPWGGARWQSAAASAKARPGRWQRACGAPRSTGLVARARGAPRQLTCRTLSERSELCDGPQGRAPQGSRCAAPTAPPKRCRPPGRDFAELICGRESREVEAQLTVGR